MKQVTRYLCEHCKKLFKIKRHFCRKDPANRSCVTCKWFRTIGSGSYCKHEHYRRFSIYDYYWATDLKEVAKIEPTRHSPILSVTKQGKIHGCKLWEEKEGEE